MPGTKTWVVTSARPRPTHSAVDGESVPLFESFSNGLQYPGDPSGTPAETANCSCALDLEFENTFDRNVDKTDRARADWMSSLSDAWRAELDSLDSTQFYTINGALRSGNYLDYVIDLMGRRMTVLEHAERVDRWLAETGLNTEEGQLFYRGIDADFAAKLGLGDTFEDKAFMFVSDNPNLARQFTHGSGTILEFLPGPGTKYLYGNWTQYSERILDRGLRWKVLGRREIEGNTIITLVPAT